MSKEIVVDIGCGIGSSTLNYSSIKGLCVGVDQDINMLLLNSHVSSGKLTPVCAKAESLPFKNESVTKVYATHVLEHLSDGSDEKALEEVYRILVLGGGAILAVPHQRFEKIMGAILNDYHSPKMHQQIFTEQEFTNRISRAGLKVDSLKTRKWFTAVNLICLALLSRFFPGKVKFQPQMGFIKRDLPLTEKLKKTIEKLGKRSENVSFLVPLLNKILPFEIYAQATKQNLRCAPGETRTPTPLRA